MEPQKIRCGPATKLHSGSSCACVHMAFIAISVPFLSEIGLFHPSVLLPHLPEAGQRLPHGIHIMSFLT